MSESKNILKSWEDITDGTLQLNGLIDLPLIGCIRKNTSQKKKIPLQPLRLNHDDFIDSNDNVSRNSVRKQLFKAPSQPSLQEKGSKRQTLGSNKMAINLKPLVLTPADLDCVGPPKQIDNNVRKSLFKVPTKKVSNIHKQSLNHRYKSPGDSVKKYRDKPKLSLEPLDPDSPPNQKIVQKELFKNVASKEPAMKQRQSLAPPKQIRRPSVNAESKLARPKIPAKKVLKPEVKKESQKQQITHPTITRLKKEELETIKEQNSCDEFLDIERLCLDDDNKEKLICGGNNIGILNEIKDILEENRRQQQENYNKIMKLLNQFQSCTCNKENAQEVKKSPKKTIDIPIDKPSEDLESEVENRTLKKAVDMYNNFRQDCTILCTPKLNNRVDSPLSIKRTLSRKIQNQCLMLLETPKH